MIGCFTVGDHTAVVDTRYREPETGMPQDRIWLLSNGGGGGAGGGSTGEISCNDMHNTTVQIFAMLLSVI